MLNILVAFPYMEKELISMIKENNKEIRLLLDSGAFTAWKSGKPIQIEKYIDFIKSSPVDIWRYFTLDVIGDGHGSYVNYKKFIEKNLNPIPIFTRGDNISMVDEYYKTSDLLGIGGLVGTKGNKGFVKGISKYIKGRNVHWLGFVNLPFIMAFTPYSVDSSSWSGAVRYGRVDLYMGSGRSISLGRDNFISRPSKDICDRMMLYGINPINLSKKSSWVNQGNNEGECYLRTLMFRSSLHKAIEITKKTKTLCFSAVACAHDLEGFLFANKFLKEKGII